MLYCLKITVYQKRPRVGEVFSFVKTHFYLAAKRVAELLVDLFENWSLAKESIGFGVETQLALDLVLLEGESNTLNSRVDESIAKESDFSVSS